MKIKPKYSGKRSRKFWNAINSIENECDQDELYSLGVALQDLEGYVLKQLEFKTKQETSINDINCELLRKRLKMYENGKITITELLYQYDVIIKKNKNTPPEAPPLPPTFDPDDFKRNNFWAIIFR